MFLIRGVLLAGQFRSQHDLDKMSHDDMRNTLIVELAGRSRQTNLQSFNDDTLAGMGALLVYLRTARIRDDAVLKTMTADDMRNILIVELVRPDADEWTYFAGHEQHRPGAAGSGQAATRQLDAGRFHSWSAGRAGSSARNMNSTTCRLTISVTPSSSR